MFPQTAFFSANTEGLAEQECSQRIYDHNTKLQIFARENISRQLLSNLFPPKNIACVPDIVLYLQGADIFQVNYNRQDIVCCFRNDDEGVISPEEKEHLISQLSQLGHIITADTVLDHMVSIEEREIELLKLRDIFLHAKLVITDRLHEMIFAAITNTPCIVFANYNHKITESYKWLKDFPYIHFIQNISSFSLDSAKHLIDADVCTFRAPDIHHHFSDLEDALRSIAKS